MTWTTTSRSDTAMAKILARPYFAPAEQVWSALVQQRREELAQKKRCTEAMLAAGRNRRKPTLSEQQMQHWEGLR